MLRRRIGKLERQRGPADLEDLDIMLVFGIAGTPSCTYSRWDREKGLWRACDSDREWIEEDRLEPSEHC